MAVLLYLALRWYLLTADGFVLKQFGVSLLVVSSIVSSTIFDQEGFFANLNAESSTSKIFVNFRVFLWSLVI